MPTVVNSSTFDNEVIGHCGNVLVDFYTDSCNPCRFMNPILDELGQARAATLKIVKVDVIENAELAARFRVTGMPTFVLFKNGEVQKQITGSRSKKEFAAWLDT